MPVKFKVIERGQPGVSGGGDKKWYATPVSSGEKTLTDLTKDIEKISTVSGADIRAVLYALVDVMQSSLANGQIVRLGELGSLRVSFSSEGKATEKEVTANAIKQAKVIFTPAKGIKDTLATLTYEKA
ncbi:HU family DNA-binding protein [Riemerella anatipestifer]|nr:HU family DNA-binding protein [Riemerella anatipestifer]MDY3324709.1 HU family DNA-binding protein [Riemerella anatipestifer]MDY3353519.1 HU family DNA-binding protein [Riemerella anatipestifer]